MQKKKGFFCSLKAFLALFFALAVFQGCSPIKSTAEDERHQAELTLHEVQTRVDDFYHDLNCYKTEMQILDGKFQNQETALEKLKQKTQNDYLEKSERLLARIKVLEQKLVAVEGQLKETLLAVKELGGHAEETSNALVQYRGKINELEKGVTIQNLKMEEMKKIKGVLEEVALALKADGAAAVIHRVKSGDSLEKIAKTYNVSLEELKKLNQLEEDLIIVGQELKIPK
ncbi:MAG: LysM peptidoglycan-binding domain-containing protein [Parachlamydiales bacterium]|jgi:LysM repeat protein